MLYTGCEIEKPINNVYTEYSVYEDVTDKKTPNTAKTRRKTKVWRPSQSFREGNPIWNSGATSRLLP